MYGDRVIRGYEANINPKTIAQDHLITAEEESPAMSSPIRGLLDEGGRERRYDQPGVNVEEVTI